MTQKKMELLAPAGSKEAFVAACAAGADAVYLGVENFNARLSADTLKLYDLEVLADHARSRGIKTCLAFNTLVKSGEMADVTRKLARIARIRPDALIVQDFGLARIVRTHFPELPLHASTQAAVHNAAGVRVMASLGFTRAILARELSQAELRLIAARSPIGLEIFCHGALCFSVSGMCLFSSALGGMSGNRGRCAQPCRRLWRAKGESGYLFSPKDLQLAAHVPALRKIGIASLKIEGRMRSAEYVSRVVRAYRLLIDAEEDDEEEAVCEAMALLSVDYAREKTTFLFSGADRTLIEPHRAQCLGKPAGKVVECGNGELVLELSAPAQRGDRFRVSDPARDKTKSLTLNAFAAEDARCRLPYDGDPFSPGTPVFKAGDGSWDEAALEKEVDAIYRAYKKEHAGAPVNISETDTIVSRVCAKYVSSSAGAQRLWIKVDDPAWIPLLPKRKDIACLISLGRENMHAFRNALDSPPFPVEQLAAELTPYIAQRETDEYRRMIASFRAAGIRAWALNNIGHFEFFDGGNLTLIAGPFLYCWNTQAAQLLGEKGVSLVTASWEEDLANLQDLAAKGLKDMILYLYGYPPLTRSRMLERGKYSGSSVRGAGGAALKAAFESGSSVLLPAEPVALFGERARLAKIGIREFGIDLSFTAPDPTLLSELLDAYSGKKHFAGRFSFNFHRGVK